MWVNNIAHYTFPRTLMLRISRESAKNSLGDIRMVSVVAAKTVPLEDRLRAEMEAMKAAAHWV
jgi:hypothetical protein